MEALKHSLQPKTFPYIPVESTISTAVRQGLGTLERTSLSVYQQLEYTLREIEYLRWCQSPYANSMEKNRMYDVEFDGWALFKYIFCGFTLGCTLSSSKGGAAASGFIWRLNRSGILMTVFR